MERLNRCRSYRSSNESHSPIRQARRLNSRAIALSTDPKFKPSSSRTVEPEVHASFTLLRMGWDKREGRERGRERAASSPSKLSSIPSAPPSSAVFGFPPPSGFLDRVAKWSRVNIWTVPVGWPWQFSSSHSLPCVSAVHVCRPIENFSQLRASSRLCSLTSKISFSSPVFSRVANNRSNARSLISSAGNFPSAIRQFSSTR